MPRSGLLFGRRPSWVAAIAAAPVALAAGVACAAEDATPGDPPPAPAVARFDPGVMPEPDGPTEGLGWRYADLSTEETKPLRRGFKLPMEALAATKSLGSLRKAVVVAPLPDPRQPFLAVKPVAGGEEANPFTGSQVTSFRQDPMRALGQMLGAEESEAAAPAGATAAADPFGGSGQAFDASQPEVADKPAPADDADPFGSDADPFGGDDASEDPFGF